VAEDEFREAMCENRYKVPRMLAHSENRVVKTQYSNRPAGVTSGPVAASKSGCVAFCSMAGIEPEMMQAIVTACTPA
jgi:hypothetical protein